MQPFALDALASRKANATKTHFLVAAVVFFLTMVMMGSIPGKATELSAMFYDKLLHFCAYGFISALLYLGLSGSPVTRVVRTVMIAALFGLIDESIQALLPHRHASLYDLEVDILAATICASVLAYLHPLYASAAKQRRRNMLKAARKKEMP